MEENPQNHRRKKLFFDLFQKEDPAFGEFETQKPKLSPEELNEETERLWSRIQQEQITKKNSISLYKRRYFQYVAASLTLLAGAFFTFLWFQHSSTLFIETAFGESQYITLPDSSTLILNANSKLTYSKNWDQNAVREVWLEGEAFFHVQEKPSPGGIKFIVHTQNVDVEVLGTQFNVRNRRNATEVVLNSGKVKLNVGGKEPIYLEPGDWVQYSVDKQAYERKQINPETYTSWRKNVLTFEESTLAEIALVLEDIYGLDITFKDPEIAKFRFTTTLTTDQIDILYPMLEESFNLKINKNGQKITIENSSGNP